MTAYPDPSPVRASGTDWPLIASGHRLIALSDGPIGLAVLVRETGTGSPPAGAEPILIRRDDAGRRYLGALVDASGAVLDWVCLTIQDVGPGASSGPDTPNAARDAEWSAWWSVTSKRLGGRAVRTGWDVDAPPPQWLDPASGRAVCPAVEGRPLELCTDEAALAAAGLPGYAATGHRFLYDADSTGGPFVAVPGAVPPPGAIAWTDAVPEAEAWTPLNPAAGRIAVRRWSPLGLRDAFEVLGGGIWDGVRAAGGMTALAPDLVERLGLGIGIDPDDVRFGAGTGAGRRLGEILHLMLRVAAGAVHETAAMVAAVDGPLLDLHPGRFEVDVMPPSRGLPLLWTMRVSMADPPSIVARQLGAGGPRIRSAPAVAGSLHQPNIAARSARGLGQVRLADVDEMPGGIEVGGTLASPDLSETTEGDVLVLTLPIEGGFELPVRLLAAGGSGTVEHAFRSVAAPLAPAAVDALRRVVGRPMPSVPFELRPQVGTPVDGYALAVIVMEVLLTDGDQTLAAAIEAIQSLAQRLAERRRDRGGKDAELEAPALVRSILEAESERVIALGPHRLHRDPIEPAEAFDEVPIDLWCEVLAWIVSLLPGIGPDSRRADFGDSPGQPVSSMLDAAGHDLDVLVRRSRALAVGDPAAHREIRTIIRQRAAGHAASSAT